MAYDMKYGRVTVDGDSVDALAVDTDKAKAFNESEEPVFIIRAQDALAVPAIARYQSLAIEAELPMEFINALNEVIANFAEWQTDNAEVVKKPD
jgi:hypothetical protein